MNELQDLLAALLAGVVLGAIFFGGLWWTVRHCLDSKWAALWFLGSLLSRTTVVMLGFYFVMGDNWQHVIAGLLGFFIARLLLSRYTRVTLQRDPLLQKASHAP